MVGLGRLLDQHAQAVGDLAGAAATGKLHEGCGLGGVDEVVGELAVVEGLGVDRRRLVVQAGGGGVDDEVEMLGRDLVEMDRLDAELVGQLFGATLGAVGHGDPPGTGLEQRRHQAADTTAGTDVAEPNLFVLEIAQTDEGRADLTLKMLKPIEEVIKALQAENPAQVEFDPSFFLVNLNNDTDDAVEIAVNHVFDDPRRPFVEQGITAEGIVIEDDVWLGAGAIITDGVRVGRGSVVAAGAVVTRDVPPHTVVAGVPAKPVKKIEEPFEARKAAVYF